jgi:hypothetical protein
MGIFTSKENGRSGKSSGLKVTITQRAIVKNGPTAMPDGSIIPESYHDFTKIVDIDSGAHGDNQYGMAAEVTRQLGELQALQGRVLSESVQRHLLGQAGRVTTPQQYLPGGAHGDE